MRFFLCMCISRFVLFLARRSRFWLALCGSGCFFSVFVSWNIPGGQNTNTSACEMNTYPL